MCGGWTISNLFRHNTNVFISLMEGIHTDSLNITMPWCIIYHVYQAMWKLFLYSWCYIEQEHSFYHGKGMKHWLIKHHNAAGARQPSRDKRDIDPMSRACSHYRARGNDVLKCSPFIHRYPAPDVYSIKRNNNKHVIPSHNPLSGKQGRRVDGWRKHLNLPLVFLSTTKTNSSNCLIGN